MKIHPWFLLAFAVGDWLEIVTLWDEPYARRILHHFQRLSHSPDREPFVLEVEVSERQREILFQHTSSPNGSPLCAERLPGASVLGGV